MIKNVIAIYPGRFQPFGMQHKVVYDWAAKKFGVNNTFIATSDKSDNIKSPFNFASKKSIMQLFGLQNKVTQVKNTYNAAEITGKFNENTTAVVYVVGEKDQDRLSKGKYFLPYPGDIQVLNPYTQNGYYIVGPKNKEVIPGHGEMNGTNVRKVLGSKSIPVSEKHKLFKSIFGWYDEKLANMIFDKLESLNESKLTIAEVMKKKNLKMETTQPDQTKLFSKEWWSESLDLTEDISIEDIKSKFDKFVKAIKQESQETKEAFKLLILAATGKKTLTDAEQKQIGDQLKDVLKTIGLTAIAVMPGGFIAGILIKVLKAEKYITPSSFMEGYMSPEQQKAHDEKMIKLKDFLDNNTGKQFEYDFDEFPKTVYGVKIQESLLKEGGAGGHVLHPFNLPQVKTGKDLIKVFDETAKSLETVPARVKVDGVNTTLKLVTRNGKLQFAMDRGSKKEEDLQGVTVDELGKRFPEGHGMLKIGKLVLTAFNDALPKIAGDLKAIGMSDPNILLNLETVLLEAGKANVIGYERNFFAIHGLMKADMINGRRVIKEMPVNAQAIEKIADKARPVMNKIGFDLYGFKKLQPKIKQDINYSGALNTKLTVKYNDDTEVSKSLKDWLSKASNPIDDTVKLNAGKSEPVMTKKYYLDILNQNVNLDDLTTDPKEQKKIIDTAVFYHTTVLLGDVILKALTSEVGDVETHEGIMIRDNKISKDPFKITGHFIVQGMASGFRKK